MVFQNYFRLKKVYHWKKKKYFLFNQENFGDFLSKVIVKRILTSNKLHPKSGNWQLGSLGSILHLLDEGAIVWGSGINGKIKPTDAIHKKYFTYDYRAVRGTETLDKLIGLGFKLPERAIAFGDPAILVPDLFPELSWSPKKNKVCWLPNLNDKGRFYDKEMRFVDPLNSWKIVLNELLTAEKIYTSSLHGIILAEAFGVEYSAVLPADSETVFKYNDYLTGTGRSPIKIGSKFFDADKITFSSGVRFGDAKFDKANLLKTFPTDLYFEK